MFEWEFELIRACTHAYTSIFNSYKNDCEIVALHTKWYIAYNDPGVSTTIFELFRFFNFDIVKRSEFMKK